MEKNKWKTGAHIKLSFSAITNLKVWVYAGSSSTDPNKYPLVRWPAYPQYLLADSMPYEFKIGEADQAAKFFIEVEADND